MWRRLRRKSMAPMRPVVFPEQIGLLMVTVLAIALGVGLVAYALFG